MRPAALLASLLVSSILLLAGAAAAYHGMGGPNGDEGRKPGTVDPPGPKHPWGMEDGRDLGNEMRFRYSRNGPDVGITDKEGRGISMMISHMEFSGGEAHYSIFFAEKNWSYREYEDDNGSTIGRYDLSSTWHPEDEMVNITLEFRLDWTDEGGQLRYRFQIDRVPEDGFLKVRHTYRLESAETWGSRLSQKGAGVDIIGGKGAKLGRIENDERMRYLLSNKWEEERPHVETSYSDDEAFINSSIYLVKDVGTVSSEGSITLFEGFIDEIGHMIEEGVDYIWDHIASFLIGFGMIVIIMIGTLSVVSRIRVDGSEGVVLEKNRYYRSVIERNR